MSGWTVRRVCLTVLVYVIAATSLPAQQISRRLANVKADSSLVVWLIAQPGTDLDALSAAATASGARVRHVSRFVNAVSVVARGSELRNLARLRGVSRVQPVGSFFRRRAEPTADPLIRSSAQVDTLYGRASWPYDQLNVRTLHARGLRGAGVRVAVLDAGFNTLHPLMQGVSIIAERDFVNGDSVVRDEPDETQGEMRHGTAVWSLLAANVPGTLFGIAPGADYILAKTELTTSETRTEEDNWVAALEWAIGLGAEIVSSSLGYLSFDDGFSYAREDRTGDIAVTTIAADAAAQAGVLVVVSVGNDGFLSTTVNTPGDGDSVIAVGAVDSLGRVAGFSSRGPTADGRIKPDLVAGGVNVPAAGIDSGVVLVSGSSAATPLVAGLAALVRPIQPLARPFDLYQGLVQSGRNSATPNNQIGNGLPDALHFYSLPVGLTLSAPANGLLRSVTPRFEWNGGTPPPDAGPNVYFLRVASDSLMRTMVIDTFLTGLSHTPQRPFAPGLRLWWRVVVSSTTGAVESTAVHGPLLVPQWSTLLTLANPAGASIRDSLPLLRWSAPSVGLPPGPFTFDVDVYPASRTPDRAVASARGLSELEFVPAQPLERNLPFRWRVVAHLGADSQVITSPGTFLVLDETVPAATLLFQSFPNPFPSTVTGQTFTCIWFDLATAGSARLEVFDIRGRLVRRMAPRSTLPDPLPPGRYGRPTDPAASTCDNRFAWDGRDERGEFVRPGVYVYRLTAPGFQDSKRVVWLGR